MILRLKGERKMCSNCNGLGRTSNKVGKGVEWITPCSCLPDWKTVRKPQLEQIWKEASERYEKFKKLCSEESLRAD